MVHLNLEPGREFFSASSTVHATEMSSYKLREAKTGPIYKKGEVVDPAGGETGMPRCLAEVHIKAVLYF